MVLLSLVAIPSTSTEHVYNIYIYIHIYLCSYILTQIMVHSIRLLKYIHLGNDTENQAPLSMRIRI